MMVPSSAKRQVEENGLVIRDCWVEVLRVLVLRLVEGFLLDSLLPVALHWGHLAEEESLGVRLW